jgi:hypothetical protein
MYSIARGWNGFIAGLRGGGAPPVDPEGRRWRPDHRRQNYNRHTAYAAEAVVAYVTSGRTSHR